MTAYSPISQDLASALRTLKEYGPYSTHPFKKQWDEAIDLAEDVQAQLALVEHHRPGILRQLADTAYDEDQIQQRPMIKEIRELIRRYARTR